MNNNNQRPQQNFTARTMRVRYSMVFVFTIAFLFFFSQVLDNIFYDYTVVETEIIFIKKIDERNHVDIELNEITESSNSLVTALKANIKDTIDQMTWITHYSYDVVDSEEEINLMQANIIFKQNLGKLSKSLLLDPSQYEKYRSLYHDSIFIACIKNEFSINNQQRQLKSNFQIYFDEGVNFFDLSASITLNNRWHLLADFYFTDLFITQIDQDRNSILLLMIENSETTHRNFFKLIKNVYSKQNQMIETKPLEIEDIEVPIGTIIKNVDIHNNTIVYNRQIDTVLFHSLHKINGKWQKGNYPVTIIEPDTLYFRTLSLVFLKNGNDEPMLFVIYIKLLILYQPYKVKE